MGDNGQVPFAGPERRKYKRVPIALSGRVNAASEGGVATIEGLLVNVSIQGVAVECQQTLSIGEIVAFTLKLGVDVMCEATQAKVAYCYKLPTDRYIAGIQFLEFHPGDREKLEQYLKTLKVIQQTVLFKKLALDEIRRILSISREERYSEGKGIFGEGVQAQALYIVMEGAVRISKKSSRGVDEPLAIIRDGEVFGEMALLDQYPRAASATAHRDCRLLRIDSADFKVLMHDHSELANKLLWIFVHVLCQRLREADKQIVETFSSTTASLTSGFR